MVDEIPSVIEPQPERKLWPLIFQGKITVIHHNAVFGDHEDVCTRVNLAEPRTYAQYPVSVPITGWEPKKPKQRKEKTWFKNVVSDNLTWTEIRDYCGRVLWDSRSVVPCDMAKYNEVRARFANNSAIVVNHPTTATT